MAECLGKGQGETGVKGVSPGGTFPRKRGLCRGHSGTQESYWVLKGGRHLNRQCQGMWGMCSCECMIDAVCDGSARVYVYL